MDTCMHGPGVPDRHQGGHPESETAGAANTDRLFEHQTTDIEFSLASDTERKRLAGLRAALALNGGHVLHELADGTFLVTWRHLSRSLPDMNAVAAFAHQVGVRE